MTLVRVSDPNTVLLERILKPGLSASETSGSPYWEIISSMEPEKFASAKISLNISGDIQERVKALMIME